MEQLYTQIICLQVYPATKTSDNIRQIAATDKP